MISLLLTTVMAALLRKTPILMAHDCATGYLKPTIATKEVYDWTITQAGRFPQQLSCGARGFDLRPATRDGRLIMHHGAVDVHTPLTEALGEMVDWLAQPNNTHEFVVLVVHDCSGKDCDDMVDAALKKMNLTVEPCKNLELHSYNHVKEKSRLPRGGSLIIYRGCNKSNYDDRITCYPPYEKKAVTADPTDAPCCYGRQKDKEDAFRAMWAYMNRTSEAEYPWEQLSQLQALWQENAEGITIGTTLESSLVKDEERSQLNNEVLLRLKQGWFKNINFLEMNNVCDKGLEISAELLKRRELLE